MIVKESKDISEEELKHKRNELNDSLQKATNSKKKFLEQRVGKIKLHTSKVESNRKDKNDNSSRYQEFCSNQQFWGNLGNSNSLEEFQEFMLKPENVSMAANLVSFFEIYCLKESFESIKNRPKIFMSLVLLANYPDEVIPNANTEEQDLLHEVKIFYTSLDQFFKDSSDYKASVHKKISLLWIQIIHKFDVWLVKDKKALFDKMMLDFITWTKTIGKLSIKSDSWAEWEPHAIKYQNEIIKRIKDIYGDDQVKAIQNELKSINEIFADAEFFIEFDSENNNYYCIWREKSKESAETPDDNLFLTTLPEKVKSTNIRILHELMLKENINFESILAMSGKSLDQISDTNREGIIKLISAIGDKPDGGLIAKSIQEIFQLLISILCDLSGDNQDYREEIQLIDTNVDESTWISDTCVLLRWILSMCRRCCAPVRDQICKDLEVHIDIVAEADTSDKLINSISDTFTVLFDLLNLMRSDYCNFRMNSLASQIEGKNIAEAYERDEFYKKFESGFEKTENWLKSNQKEGARPIDILVDSFLGLIDPSMEELSELSTPETFYLDIQRLNKFKKDLELSIGREAVSIYVKNYLRLNNEDKVESEKLIESLSDRADSLHEMKKLIGDFLQNFKNDSKTLLSININRVFSKPSEDKVFLLLKNRELSKLRNMLISAQNCKSGTISEKICILFNYNKECYSKIYDEIIMKK